MLVLRSTTEVNEMVDLILSTYSFEGMDDDEQRAVVGQFTRYSTAAYCPEQRQRIDADLRSGLSRYGM